MKKVKQSPSQTNPAKTPPAKSDSSFLIRAFLFDLDGVLVTTDHFHQLGWQVLAKEQGWDFPGGLAHQLRGIARPEALDRILRHNQIHATANQREEWAARKNEVYLQHIAGITKKDTVPGALAFLATARKAGICTALCSASRNAPAVLETLGIRDLFDVVVCGLDVARSKPDPEVFLLAAERLHIPPFHCLVFEDAVSGIEAARRAGMKSIGVGSPESLPNASETMLDFRSVDLPAILETGRLERIQPEPWRVTQSTFRPARAHYWESLFALSNGRLGVRGSLEETPWPEQEYAATFANGVFGRKPYVHLWKLPGFAENLEIMLGLLNWLSCDLEVDGERMGPDRAMPGTHTRWLDLRAGVLVREAEFRASSGGAVRLRSTRMVSMRRRHAALVQYTVEAITPCVVRLGTGVSVPAGHWHLPGQPITLGAMETRGNRDTFSLEPTDGSQAAVAAVVTRFSNQEEVEVAIRREERAIWREISLSLAPGATLQIEKHLALLTTLEIPKDDLVDRAHLEVERDAKDGVRLLLEEQGEWWAQWWDAWDMAVEGAPADQQAVRFNLFQLRQSFPEQPTLSIGANFLTGDKYCGHVFWDTEMYIAPMALYTEPRLVKSLLEYRYGLLDRARKRARDVGNRGALFAWNSISGEECATVFEASTAEYHLVSAVAWAVFRYVKLSGDVNFLWDQGAEMLFETARFLEDLGGYVPHRNGAFCLNAVCGPDEYNCGVNNNAYTNVMAQWHLAYAAEIYDRMQVEAPEKFATLVTKIGLLRGERDGWVRASQAMFIPWNKKLGIHPQDDSFLHLAPVDMTRIPMHTDIREKFHPLKLWRTQVCKQADTVLMLFVQGHQFSRKVKAADYDFYEPRTNHGSSLSACIHAILAAELGRVEEAYRFFQLSARMDLNDFKGNVAGGLHAACMGGTWMALVHGFGGMRDYPDGLHFAPTLPKAWTGLRFRMAFEGTSLECAIGPKTTRFHWLAGPALRLRVAQKWHPLGPLHPSIEARTEGSKDK